MTKERELLRQALEAWDNEDDVTLIHEVLEEIRTYLSTPSDDAEEPVAIIEEADYGCWGQILPDKSVRLGQFLYLHPPKPAALEAEPVAYINLDEKRLEWAVPFEFKSSCFVLGKLPLYLHPPKPAEPEAEPMSWPIDREWLRSVLRFAEKNPDYFYDVEPGFVSLDGGDTDAVIAALNKPAEQEAETIETLKAENFKLASGQCTEGGPWGDEGGTPYCKYTNPAEPAKKPMTDFREYFEEMHSQLQEDYGDNVHIFEAGFKEGARWVQLDHSVFKHHGIGDADL